MGRKLMNNKCHELYIKHRTGVNQQTIMTEICIKALVSGRVQGVFFRESTRRQALQLGLTGYAINLSDGRVEVLACGDAAQLERLVRWLHTGPEYARVTDVDSRQQPFELHQDFKTG